MMNNGYETMIATLITTHITKKFLYVMRVDKFIGMFISEIGTWSIIVVGASVLHAHGVTDIKTAADAAKAIEPLVQTFPHAGMLAKLIFSLGIVGLGLVSVPVLASSASYAVCETLGWREGLNLKYYEAYGFYGIIILATVLGLLIRMIHIDPFKMLVYAAVINGIVAVPLIFIIALIARNKSIMNKHRSGFLSDIFVWLTFSCTTIATLAMVVSFFWKS